MKPDPLNPPSPPPCRGGGHPGVRLAEGILLPSSMGRSVLNRGVELPPCQPSPQQTRVPGVSQGKGCVGALTGSQ